MRTKSLVPNETIEQKLLYSAIHRGWFIFLSIQKPSQVLIMALNVWTIIKGKEKMKSKKGFHSHKYSQSTIGRKMTKKCLINSICDKEIIP